MYEISESRVLSEDTFEDVRWRMVATRVEFISQLARFQKKELTRPSVIGTMSPLCIAYHLSLVDQCALHHMHCIQEQDNPSLTNITSEATRLHTQVKRLPSLSSLLTSMAATRVELFAYLAQLSPPAWQRPFQHIEWGTCEFRHLVVMLPLYDRQHTQQLVMLKGF
jgi:hypothetical protein